MVEGGVAVKEEKIYIYKLSWVLEKLVNESTRQKKIMLTMSRTEYKITFLYCFYVKFAFGLVCWRTFEDETNKL